MVPAHLDLAKRTREARALHPRGLGRDANAQELIERGWPHLRILEAGKADPRKARKALQAIDPHTGPRWVRSVAVGFVQAFALGIDPFKGELPAATADPDAALLGKLVERGFQSVLGYPFAHADALFIFEALLGADAVVGEFAAALSSAPAEIWSWDNPNQRIIAQLTALGWILLRAGPHAAGAALAEIAAARGRAPKKASPVHRAVDFLLGEAEPDIENEPERRLRVVHFSPALAHARVAHPWRLWICDPQDLWVTGVAPPESALAGLAKEPRWFPEHLAREWQPFHHPFSDALSGARDARPSKLGKKQLQAAVGALFAQLTADLKKARGKSAVAIVKRAAVELVTLRSRAGDPTPEFHIGHILAVDGWDEKHPPPLLQAEPSEEELRRWLAAIEEALG